MPDVALCDKCGKLYPNEPYVVESKFPQAVKDVGKGEAFRYCEKCAVELHNQMKADKAAVLCALKGD